MLKKAWKALCQSEKQESEKHTDYVKAGGKINAIKYTDDQTVMAITEEKFQQIMD